MRVGPVDEIRMLIARGDRGCGKTTMGIYACAALAERLMEDKVPLPLRVAVVRDTWTNIERTTIQSFREQAQRGVPLEITNGGKEAVLKTSDGTEFVHFWFFGLDRPDDADKLQGFSCGVLWPEEVAPAAGISGGIPQSVLGLGVTSLRQAGVPPRILVTMNPPDKNHWILHVEKALAEMNLPHIRVRHFHIPPAEKSAHFYALSRLDPDPESAKKWRDAAVAHERYRDRNRAFLLSIGRPDLAKRLVEGEIGDVQLGKAVVPNFSRELHVPVEPIKIVRGLEIVRGWDSGINDLHPAVCWMQVGPDWVNVLGSRVGDNVTLEEFIRTEVWPFERHWGLVKATKSMAGRHGARQGFTFRNIGDPAMFAGDGSKSARTAAMTLENLMNEGVEPGPVEWEARRSALFSAFNRKGPGGRMLVQIDPDENEILIDGLAGRFHYPEVKATGEPIADIAAAKRASGKYSHPVDAMAYPLCIFFPAHEYFLEKQQEPAPGGPVIGSWMGR